jgi:shikimate kinase
MAIMSVQGSGKSTIGKMLAKRLGMASPGMV